ncbi:sensor histidine kinase [Kumtagia ephedrae]|nr:sensor histidine kinase [Mesorhizobium ephedrae]
MFADTSERGIPTGVGDATAPSNTERPKRRWHHRSLVFQFFFIGGLVSLCAMLVVGAVVSTLIERAVTRSAGATTALYVDSVIAPLLPDMQRSLVLDEAVKRALDETLGQGALGSRLAAMRLWGPDGQILYSDDESLIGLRLGLSDSLRRAFSGAMVANYEPVAAIEEVASGPVLQIYNPILQPWSGEPVAVIEFFEFAHEFEATLRNARLRSWLAVAAVTAVFFLALNAVVLRGSRTIDRQAHDLKNRVADLSALLEQNSELHERVRNAAQRATTLNERYLRRLGADLHDGPAQLVALASLRLDSATVLGPRVPTRVREREVASIRATLNEALQEIRSICNGLVLPQVETATVLEVVNHAIDSYEKRTGTSVGRHLTPPAWTMSAAGRICIYRFLQEALNNGYRHCRGAHQVVTMTTKGQSLSIAVSDDGPGFDPTSVGTGRIGLAGLRERVESLGGSFHLHTSSTGTEVAIIFDNKPAPS